MISSQNLYQIHLIEKVQNMLFLNICSCILAWLKIDSALISSALELCTVWQVVIQWKDVR